MPWAVKHAIDVFRVFRVFYVFRIFRVLVFFRVFGHFSIKTTFCTFCIFLKAESARRRELRANLCGPSRGRSGMFDRYRPGMSNPHDSQ